MFAVLPLFCLFTSKAYHAYTTGTLGTAQETIPNTYGDSNWKDKLTSYNGGTIMSTVCKQAISMFTAMEEFSPSSVTEVHKCLEQELSNDTVRWICDIVSESVDVQKRKYGTSALLMGPLGYYHPSRINELTSTNVRRGRISRNMPSSYTFVYDYNETGAVIRITNVHACTVTYILHQEMCDICISVQQGTNEIEHIMPAATP